MLKSSGICDRWKPCNSPVTLVLRAIRLSDLQNVILKLPSAEQPRPRQLARLRHEHQLPGPCRSPASSAATASSTRCRGWCWCWKTLAAARLQPDQRGCCRCTASEAGHRGDDCTKPRCTKAGSFTRTSISNIVWNQDDGQAQLTTLNRLPAAAGNAGRQEPEPP